MSNLSNGHLERKVKSRLKAQWKMQNAPCAYNCGRPIDYNAPRNHPDSIEAAHKLSVKTHPHLAYDPTNFAPAHSSCNRAGQNNPIKPITKPKRWVPANWG